MSGEKTDNYVHETKVSRRSRSPRRKEFRGPLHRQSPRRYSSSATRNPVILPYDAKPLSKQDYETYRLLFASYLNIQKNLYLNELDEREAQGRWKSFVRHWNFGDLARSWYDPSMLTTAREALRLSPLRASSQVRCASSDYSAQKFEPQENSDDDYGPAPPSHVSRSHGHGPVMPRMDDLIYRDEARNEDRERERAEHQNDLRHDRKAERKEQRSRLDELIPRADPGSRQRQLEKKREATSTLQSFRNAKEGGEVEVGESDLMGDDGDALRQQKKFIERCKNEREIRREEIARAKAAEWEERLTERREKEDKTMEFLKHIAKERYG